MTRKETVVEHRRFTGRGSRLIVAALAVAAIAATSVLGVGFWVMALR